MEHSIAPIQGFSSLLMDPMNTLQFHIEQFAGEVSLSFQGQNIFHSQKQSDIYPYFRLTFTPILFIFKVPDT